MQEGRRHVITIADAGFGGMSWNHPMAGVVEQQSRQQVVGFVAYDGAMVRPFDSDRSLLTRSLDFLLLSSSKTIRRSRDRASRDAGARRPARGMGVLPI
jgi:hypothetical protein